MPTFNLICLLALAASAGALTTRIVASPQNLTPLASLVLPPAEHFVGFTGSVPRTSRRKELFRQLATDLGGTGNFTTPVAGSGDDEEYLVDITVGGQYFKVIVDTGSSDTWFPEVGFKCFNLTSFPESPSSCRFGTAGFDPSKSYAFMSAPNENFNISYGDGEFLTGNVGYDTVAVGGLAVTQQEIGLVKFAAWNGDGVNSGLLGLAFPNLTSVYSGSNPNDDSAANSLPYNPFFFSAIEQKAVAHPYFSVALNRGSWANQANSTLDPNLGFLAFGGIAPVPVTSTSITVPVQGYATTAGSSAYFYYTVDLDAYTFPTSNSVVSKSTAILDTGTTLNYVPAKVAKAYNAQFSPPAKFKKDEDTYYVHCNATAPPFSVVIGGQSFPVDGKDQILPVGTDKNGNELCISGTQSGGSLLGGNIFVLGDVFLHNVVTTFQVSSTNPAKNKITLTERQSY